MLYNKEEHSGLRITSIKSGRESWNKVLLRKAIPGNELTENSD
jgi:hypothetical protein